VRHLEYPLLVDNEFHIIQSQSLPPPLEAFEMPSVGPELPPHLIKRKRSIDDEEGLNSPPRKVQAALGPMLPHAQNPDELDIEESSQDEFGPSIPSKAPAQNLPHSKRVLGPAPPPTTNPDALDLSDSDDDDEYGPSKPSVKASTPPKRILGPAPPPASLAEMPSHPPTADSDSSSDDDDYGPSLPPAPGSAAEAALLEQQAEERFTAARTTQVAPKLQREEWMLAPPSDSDWTGRVDPTKLKNRKFASGKGSKAPAEKTGVSAIWTETPEQKRQRLEDEVLGRKDAASSSRASAPKPAALDREEAATAQRIKEYNEKNRSKSLYAEREAAQASQGQKVEDDDPSKRGFDREKDMALGGRLGHGQKKEMLAKAADFGSRFQKGRYL
jgi:hypothetical protein